MIQGTHCAGDNPQILPRRATLAWDAAGTVPSLMEEPSAAWSPAAGPRASEQSECSRVPAPLAGNIPVIAAAARPQGHKECPGFWP